MLLEICEKTGNFLHQLVTTGWPKKFGTEA